MKFHRNILAHGILCHGLFFYEEIFNNSWDIVWDPAKLGYNNTFQK